MDIQKKEYSTLKSEEKNAIWQSRINTFVDNNELSLVQKQVLTELQTNLNALLFEKSSLNKAKELESEWLPKALMVFNPKAIKLLVGGLQDEILAPEIIKGKNLRGVYNASVQCGCNGDSFFDCDPCNPIDDCSLVQGECGFLWMFDCEQSCYIAPR